MMKIPFLIQSSGLAFKNEDLEPEGEILASVEQSSILDFSADLEFFSPEAKDINYAKMNLKMIIFLLREDSTTDFCPTIPER